MPPRTTEWHTESPWFVPEIVFCASERHSVLFSANQWARQNVRKTAKIPVVNVLISLSDFYFLSVFLVGWVLDSKSGNKWDWEQAGPEGFGIWPTIINYANF